MSDAGITLSAVTLRALQAVDDMPPDMRACVHEIGWEPVVVMRQLGLKPNQMRAIAQACWTAPRSARQNQNDGSSPVLQHLDVLLNRAGAQISALMLLAFLKRSGMVVVPFPASTPMLEASLATVKDHNLRLTKDEKHRRRLNAALDAGAQRLWPTLFDSQSGQAPNTRGNSNDPR